MLYRNNRKAVLRCKNVSFFSTGASSFLESLFQRVEKREVEADYNVLSSLLGSCKNLIQVKQVDRLIIQSKVSKDWFLRNQVLQVYVKHGGIEHAKQMFETASEWNVVSWTCMVAANARHGHHKEAFMLFFRMQLEGLRSDKVAFITLLQVCKQPSQINHGMLIWNWICEAGFGSDVLLGNVLINMLSKCGSLEKAERWFDQMSFRDTGTWNALISAYVSFRSRSLAFQTFNRMQLEGSRPDSLTFMSLVSGSGALKKLKLLHSWILMSSSEEDVILSTALLNAYSKCGSLIHARSVFDGIQRYDLVSLNAMIAAFALHGCHVEAFDLFQRMFSEHKIRPDKVSFLNVLSASSSVAGIEFLEQGRLVHDLIRNSGLEGDVAVGTALVDMYSRCGCVKEARMIFDGLLNRDLIAWNAMLSGYARHNKYHQEVLELFRKMTVTPDRVSFAAALHACAGAGELETGREIHSRITKEECFARLDALVRNALIHMYSKCGDLGAAAQVFVDGLSESSCLTDTSFWNNMLAAYTDFQLWSEAMRLVHRMQQEGVALDEISLVTVLNVIAGSSSERLLREGETVHRCVKEAGLEGDVIVATALLNMYSKCGDLKQSCAVFEELATGGLLDLIAWNAMSSGYLQHQLHRDALRIFNQMQLEGVKPNEISFINAVSACEAQPIENLEKIHSLAAESGFVKERVVATVLITIYGACGVMDKAEEIFGMVWKKDVVLWNAMISAYGSSSSSRTALEVYQRMDLAPDKLTFVLALNACAGLADSSTGTLIHQRLAELGFDSDMGSITALINMYAKCGRLEQAETIFKTVVDPSLFMWNALISGYASQGYTRRAIVLFGRMQQWGNRADAISFVSILGACSQSGCLPEGCCYFTSLVHDFGIVPLREHFACMIDLFGRAGRLEEAEEWIERMPVMIREQQRKTPHRNNSPWETLLGACAIHKDLTRGRRAAGEVFGLRHSSKSSSPYVIMANLWR